MSTTYLIHQLISPPNLAEDDILTFDDAHCSIIEHIDWIKDLPNKKILFITPNFISLEDKKERNDSNIYYMDDFFINHSRDQFLTLGEIELLINKYGFEIGMHSFYHDIVYVPIGTDYRKKDLHERQWYYHKIPNNPEILLFFTYISALAVPGYDMHDKKDFYGRTKEEFEEYIEEDTSKCIDWFKKYLFFTNKYAYPFFETSPELDKTLKNYGLTNIYGERKIIS